MDVVVMIDSARNWTKNQETIAAVEEQVLRVVGAHCPTETKNGDP